MRICGAVQNWAFCAPQNLKSVFVFRQILAVTLLPRLAGGGRQRAAAVSLVAGPARWRSAGRLPTWPGASTPPI